MADGASGALKIRARVRDAFLDGAACARRWSSADATGARAIASLTNLLSRLDVVTTAAGGVRGVSPWLFNGTGIASISMRVESDPTLLGPLAAFHGIAPRLVLVHADEIVRTRALLCGVVLDVLRDQEIGIARASAVAVAAIAKATPAVREAAEAVSVEAPVSASELVYALQMLCAAIAMRTGRRVLAALQTAADVDVGGFVGATGEGIGGAGGESSCDDDDKRRGGRGMMTTRGGDSDNENDGAAGSGRAAAAALRVATTAQAWAADALECDTIGAIPDFSNLLWKLEGTVLFSDDGGGGGAADG